MGAVVGVELTEEAIVSLPDCSGLGRLSRPMPATVCPSSATRAPQRSAGAVPTFHRLCPTHPECASGMLWEFS